ncbi:MAG: chorismate mutase [Proteobacteria bacterium]|nr:chorismate mutase [Pseudomonadota bacterium]
MSKLEELRVKLDKLDDDIAKLLHARAEVVLDVRKAKEQEKVDVYSPTRERQILNRVLSLDPNGKFPKPALEKIFLSIISSSRSLIGDLKVGYVGPEFSLGREAGEAQFGGDLKFSPEASIEDVFKKVETKEVDYGVVPAISSNGNFIAKTLDLLMQTPLQIISEVNVKEKLCLVGKAPGLSAVRQVYADAYSFERAIPWLKNSLTGVDLKLVESSDLAIKIAKENSNAAAIALESAAIKNSLYVLASGIESESQTEAKFYILGFNKTEPTGNDKTVMACSVKEKAGALKDILQPFSAANISLLKIESRPVKIHGLEYVFFIDAIGHQNEKHFQNVLSQLEPLCSYIKIFGSFAQGVH